MPKMSGNAVTKVMFGEGDGTDARRERLAAAVTATGGDPWCIALDLTLPARAPIPDSTRCVVRPAGADGDTERLVEFGRTGLSVASRKSFGP